MMTVTQIGASLVVQLAKNLSAVWETWIWSLRWEDTLEKEKATHSSILAWRMAYIVHGPKSQTRQSDFHFHTDTDLILRTQRLTSLVQENSIKEGIYKEICIWVEP